MELVLKELNHPVDYPGLSRGTLARTDKHSACHFSPYRGRFFDSTGPTNQDFFDV